MNLLDLTKAQTFCINKLIKIVIVSKDKHLVLTAFKIVTSSFKGLNNSQKLIIISFITSFCKNYLSKKKNYWMVLTNFR